MCTVRIPVDKKPQGIQTQYNRDQKNIEKIEA